MESQNHQENRSGHDHEALQNVAPGDRPETSVGRVNDHGQGKNKNAQDIVGVFRTINVALFFVGQLLASDSEAVKRLGGDVSGRLIGFGFLHPAAGLPHDKSAGFELSY